MRTKQKRDSTAQFSHDMWYAGLGLFHAFRFGEISAGSTHHVMWSVPPKFAPQNTKTCLRNMPVTRIHGKNMSNNLHKIWPQKLRNKANLAVWGPYFCSHVCSLYVGVGVAKGIPIITSHDVLEPSKGALLASHDVISSAQICGSKLQRFFSHQVTDAGCPSLRWELLSILEGVTLSGVQLCKAARRRGKMTRSHPSKLRYCLKPIRGPPTHGAPTPPATKKNSENPENPDYPSK